MIRSDQKPDAPIEAQSATSPLAPVRELATQLLISPDAIDPAFVGDPIHSLVIKTSATAEAGSEKRRSYKPLRRQFQHGGFDFRQIYREGDFAIYEQIWSGCPNPTICYEVIRIRHREGFRIGGRFVEPAEIYPNSETWGADGWTVQDKEAAFRKFREVVRERSTMQRFRSKRMKASLKKSPT